MFKAIIVLLAAFSINARVINVPAGYPSIQAGVNAAVAGDSVVVQSGTYAPVFVSNKNSIFLSGVNMPKITRGSILTDTTCIKILNGRRWTIKGFETESTHVGICVYNCTTMTITGNYVHDHVLGNNAEGIYIVNSDSVLVSYNLVLRNEFAGIEPFFSSHTNVVNNTIAGTLNYEGLLVTGIPSQDINIINNILFQNGGNGIEFRFDLVQSGKIRYNLLWGNVQTPICNNCTLDSTDITTQDPLFVNSGAGNYHLAQNSPAIDAGDPGTPRDPDGTRADMGAFYFSRGQSPVLIPVPSPNLNRKPVFRWHSLAGAASYTIQIDTTPNFISPLISLPTSDTFFVPLTNLPVNTIYWRVGAGQPISYSQASSFIIQEATIPVLIPYSPSPTQERRPTLKWHSVAGASDYRIMVAHDSGFVTPDISISVADTFFTPLVNLATGTVYWKVSSSLNAQYSPWSSFVIQADTIPLLYAFNGANVANRRPLFRWKPVARAASYRIQIDTLKSFIVPMTSIEVSDTTFTPLSNMSYDRYYWRVSCNLNMSAYSVVDSLNIVAVDVENDKFAASMGNLTVSPNPLISAATICFSNPDQAASIVIRDINGRTVARGGDLRADRWTWNAAGDPSGVYFVTLFAGGRILNKRVCLIK